MRVAVVGLAPSTHHQAPWDDPEWEVWGLPWDGRWAQMDRFFEMHDRGLLEEPEADRSEDYWQRMKEEIDWGPIYMQRPWPDIPKSVAYPLEWVGHRVFERFPRRDWDRFQVDWYNDSMAYMLALAIAEDAETIGIWGVDVRRDSEFALARPCLEYLIGLANGRGIEVTLPEGPTALCSFDCEGVNLGTMHPHYPRRYGYLR